jgi:hypothetical protein
VSEVLPPERKHPLLINLKFSQNSGMIVYHCRTASKNFKIFNETGKDFVLILWCVPRKTYSQQAMTKVKYVLVPDVK